MWSVAPLSRTNQWRRNDVCDKPEEVPASLALGLEDWFVPLLFIIDNICWNCISESPFITDCISCSAGPSLTWLAEDWAEFSNWERLPLRLNRVDLCFECPGGYPCNFQHMSHTWWSLSQYEQCNGLRLEELEREEPCPSRTANAVGSFLWTAMAVVSVVSRMSHKLRCFCS